MCVFVVCIKMDVEKQIVAETRKKANLKQEIQLCRDAAKALENERKGGKWRRRKEGACPYDSIVDVFEYDSEADKNKYKALNMGIDEGKSAVWDKKRRLSLELDEVEKKLEKLGTQL